MSTASKFQSKILTRGATQNDYDVYRAALEWDLADPIVIESADDFKSKQRWREKLTPYHHQVTNLITFCRRLPVTLLADDVGLGKTVSAGLIASELISRSRLRKILIVCPKVLTPQWKEELESKFEIPTKIAVGSELLRADSDEVGAVVTTYNSARLHLEKIPQDRFQMLILDEAHKLRNLYGVEDTPQVAKRFRKALEDRRFKFVLMLTATPIQNRLWDLYSLIDLLTVARGHTNPFGSEGLFARRFIADSREQARQLKQEAREEFRSIVYSYMSRVRRGDAQLYFPDRVVQMHRVDPTPAEAQIIKTIAKPIQKLNRLTQISILQALTSSPEALSAQLQNMARNGTAPADLAVAVKTIVATMPSSAKLLGLSRLIEQLITNNHDRWRLVIFTGRRETQTTIQLFLQKLGLAVGLINGDSAQRNQETIKGFRENPPRHRVIVSTEAGSEGVNLQVANVLVNYDLPWNPMIVEQRIGRVQRLASQHAHVSIYNAVLRGTFEEYIVGRLMEKLQMAAHAIGDIEALLQGSDIGGSKEGDASSFEDHILKLVLAALAGKNVEEETRLAERSIERAKTELESEENNINSLLGSMDGKGYVGPRAPSLPPVSHSMDVRQFTLAALPMLGVQVSPVSPDIFLAQENAGREYIRFSDINDTPYRTSFYEPGSPPFERLVGRMISTALCRVDDLDREPAKSTNDAAANWVSSFGAQPRSIEIEEIKLSFEGNALLRVRAVVAHDSYERLVNVPCQSRDHRRSTNATFFNPLPRTVEDPRALGIDIEHLSRAAALDDAISEFSRFYLERREQEVRAAGSDERKRKKLFDDFTPGIDATLVGLSGDVHRAVRAHIHYDLGSNESYESIIEVTPHNGEIIAAPKLGRCTKTGQTAPYDCLAKCDISGAVVLRHLLVKSEVSGRLGQPEFSAVCDVSGKCVLRDELEKSAVTGRNVIRALLRTSALSGKRAEAEHFVNCSFTDSPILLSESAASEVSGKRYRIDQEAQSAVSGKKGHKNEFLACYETGRIIATTESEKCELTGRQVQIGRLQTCSMSGKRVLPAELGLCVATGKHALKEFLVTSSVSGASILRSVAIRSSKGSYCAPAEAQGCFWSGSTFHPEDIRVCSLTGLLIHFQFSTPKDPDRLKPLAELLDGARHNVESNDDWLSIAEQVARILKGGRCEVEAALISPNREHLATCVEVRTLLGLRLRQAGAIYSFRERSIVGRVTTGRRAKNGWYPE
jgi:superfamily II DNA or RNA helicase